MVTAYEQSLKYELRPRVISCQDEALNERAKIVYDEVVPFLAGESLLDIGCGNGLISNLAARDRFDPKNVLLVDVVRYVPMAFNLAFKLYREGDSLPIDDAFDTVLLLTVLHHSSDPVSLLKQAWGATRKRLIIIESVIGIDEVHAPAKYALVNEPVEDQIAFAAFIDWFYNRVLHDDIPVPYNFTTPAKWRSVFSQHNMRVTESVYLGQDIAIGPEYHMLFVLQK